MSFVAEISSIKSIRFDGIKQGEHGPVHKLILVVFYSRVWKVLGEIRSLVLKAFIKNS
jgi:hypothetical protein